MVRRLDSRADFRSSPAVRSGSISWGGSIHGATAGQIPLSSCHFVKKGGMTRSSDPFCRDSGVSSATSIFSRDHRSDRTMLTDRRRRRSCPTLCQAPGRGGKRGWRGGNSRQILQVSGCLSRTSGRRDYRYCASCRLDGNGRDAPARSAHVRAPLSGKTRATRAEELNLQYFNNLHLKFAGVVEGGGNASQ